MVSRAHVVGPFPADEVTGSAGSLLEQLDEAQILAIDAAGDVANCSVTSYAFDAEARPSLRAYNFVAPLQVEGAPVTTRPDAPAPRS